MTPAASDARERSKASVQGLRATVLSIPVDPDLRAYGNDRVDVVFVEAEDEDGRTGTGFTYTFGPGCTAVRSMVDDVIAPAVHGRPVSHWPALHAELTAATRRLGRGVFVPAISAVDIAMWDLRALGANKPLHELLGGSSRSVPIYGSGRSSNALSEGQLVERTESYLAEGYRAVKLRVGARAVEADLARVRAVRHAVGPEIRLMVDCNERLNVADAVWLGDHLSEHGVFWMEEPVPAEQLASYRSISARSAVPIAAGEHLAGHAEFTTYIVERLASVLQPDCALAGGITEIARVCEFAGAQSVPVALHSLAELHIHLAVASTSVSFVEHFPILDHVIAEPLVQHDGMVSPPPRPGHGIMWDREALRACTLGS